MQRSYGRKGPSPFDRLVNEQCQKGVVSRWSEGNPSSSLLESSSAAASSAPKKKKFFKSREEPRVLASGSSLLPSHHQTTLQQQQQHQQPVEEQPAKKSKKAEVKHHSPCIIPEEPRRTRPKRLLRGRQEVESPSHEEEEDPPPRNLKKVPPLRIKLPTASLPIHVSTEEEEGCKEEEELPPPLPPSPQEADDVDMRGEEGGSPEEKPDSPNSLPPSPQRKEERVEEKRDEPRDEEPPSPLTKTEEEECLTQPLEPPIQEEEGERGDAHKEADLSLEPPEPSSPSTASAQEMDVSSVPEPSLRSPPTRTASLTLTSIRQEEERRAAASSSVKTRSIFKSKAGSRKAKYNHQWSNMASFGSPEGNPSSSSLAKSASLPLSASSPADMDTPFDLVKVTKPKDSAEDPFGEGPGSDTVSSLRVSRSQKSYFTVVKSVKKAHQIQDSGEFQEFNDDVDYILGGLGGSLPLSTRCLSTMTLASKCMESNFRMHLRAHSCAPKFFTELRDSPGKASLALCAAAVLFVLSQDRLNMDLDKNSLELMLNLLDTESRGEEELMDEREFLRNKGKVRDLVAAMKAKGHAQNLSLDQISADNLAMETLLSLTSKRAGDWFKEDLRDLGGLDHLVRTLSECVNYLLADEITLWTQELLCKLRKADRVLKVLENVTSENQENCHYLYSYEKGKCFKVVHSLLRLLSESLPSFKDNLSAEKDSVGYVLSDVLLDVIRVYINLVHDTSIGSSQDLIHIIFHSLFVLPNFVPANKSFDTGVLSLTLLINLVENCEENRRLLFTTHISPEEVSTGVEGLVDLFLEKESSARHEESKTDNILDGVPDEGEKQKAQESEEKKSREEAMDETIAKLLQKAGRHMEDTLIASYITLILGYTILDNKESEADLRKLLPNQDFVLMVSILKKFYNFMNLTASSTLASSRGMKATEKIIKYLVSIDSPPEAEEDANVSAADISLSDGLNSSTNSNILEESNNTSHYDMDDFGAI